MGNFDRLPGVYQNIGRRRKDFGGALRGFKLQISDFRIVLRTNFEALRDYKLQISNFTGTLPLTLNPTRNVEPGTWNLFVPVPPGLVPVSQRR
ncbi:MAG: hypothetical protein DWQ47_10560 [Acidobacteria bacterium]|nr:MAG: hypothetical protein DWQ32_12975 [Acidobacteriota bacterium]REJ98027.1 MAG: hypothetical protein DWQ38_15775 [Acidobacteriota bacterium]REK16770.1 MAG: hypothetical protein DWQ43_00820 [Acidobacteriota bacterium]REK42681.1 MAG: hypothetical protein DWQ47_10560 [Acidobacteriota bacterium]